MLKMAGLQAMMGIDARHGQNGPNRWKTRVFGRQDPSSASRPDPVDDQEERANPPSFKASRKKRILKAAGMEVSATEQNSWKMHRQMATLMKRWKMGKGGMLQTSDEG